ncbi:hypothetical protein [Pseudodesulfovibrio piezophilus]|uniref:hypothetical protein n=1 Tax=Pseudodesulfovibrio piezophilus TaxID=879567 RepID=UPI0009FECBC2|nr:hypothetical protein [Pseudodesulfovibrio piezophilus]
MDTEKRPQMSCDTCRFREKAEKASASFLGKIWIWHTRFCPGWKRYVRTKWEHGEAAPPVGSLRGYWQNR